LGSRRRVGDLLTEAIAKALSVIRASASLEGLKEDPVVRAYRDFYWRLGIDPTKVRPSSEALARRAFRGECPQGEPARGRGQRGFTRDLSAYRNL
jgi:phosphoenolpyruvate synthase (EC 2.7.9.2)